LSSFIARFRTRRLNLKVQPTAGAESMAGNGLKVKDIAEIKRLWELKFSNRKIAEISSVHRNTVNKYVAQFEAQVKNANQVLALSVATSEASVIDVNKVDWLKVRSEFLSGVSLNVIHEELVEQNKVTVQYPGFWKQVQKFANLSEATMVRIFKPGERSEIDYADGIQIMDPVTGEIKETEFFVGVLCHSRYAFAEFTMTQSSADFLESHVNMFEFFGGTTQILSPDNLKSAVTKAHRYDPTINQAYTRLATHYEVAVVPARVRTPKDKAIVERTIQIFQRYFFMKVRNRTFTSLLELNQCLKEHLIIFNRKKHRIFGRTREEMYLEEKLHLRELPMDRYKVATHSRAKLGRDCHLTFDRNFYSSPHTLRGFDLDVWASSKLIEIYHEGVRVALHPRQTMRTGKFETDKNHYPPAQQAFAEEDIQTIIVRAERTGPQTAQLVRGLLEGFWPLKHFRRCQGIVALSWKYTPEHLEVAAEMANRFNNPNVQYLERVIRARKGAPTRETNEIKQRSFNPHLRGVNTIH
jgi:transposase